jgi:hypothetical protein
LETSNNSVNHGVCVFDLTIANAVMCDSDYDRIFLLDLEAANIAPVPFYQLACIAADRGPESKEANAFFEGDGVDSGGGRWISGELNRFTLYTLVTQQMRQLYR